MNHSTANVPDIIAEWDTDSDSETIILSDLQIESSTVISSDLDFQHQDLIMNSDDNYEQSATDTSNSDSESEDDVNGTLDRCRVSNPWNHSVKNKHIAITYTNIENNDLEVLQELVDMFKLSAHVVWSDSVTHLIAKTLPNGKCIRTKKFMNALLLNCFIVSLEWAKDCIISKTLLPEVDYIPLDYSGESSPLVSWRVGRGIIDSPMEWTKDCILYLHSSIEFSESYTDIKLWARKAGFVLTNDLGEFNDDYKMRIILVNKINSSNDVRAKLPNTTEITSWICDYKAVTLFLDWFLECLFQYKFIEISCNFQIMKLNSNMVEFTNMEESLFEFEIC